CPLSVHDTATSASYTLSLHDALPISRAAGRVLSSPDDSASGVFCARHRRSNEASPKFDPSHPWRDIPAADSPARPSLAGRSRVQAMPIGHRLSAPTHPAQAPQLDLVFG